MTYLIASLLLPPAGPLLLIALGLAVLGPLPVAGFLLAVAGVAILYLLSTPAVSHRLVTMLDARYQVLCAVPQEAQAIIVLGGGRNRDADEYGGDTVEYFTLERLRYAARLHRESGLPILVSGGRLFGEARSEASMMKEALEQDFRVPVTWMESDSRDTFENAVNSARILAAHDVQHALLVTHGWHMPRAVWSFLRAGLKVTPAPTACDTPRRAYRMLPTYRALYMASNASSEYLAMVWYRYRRANQT
ncbi:MAG: YdcF family protein [Gammaproteobacteria bacterium]